jgi:hypothetical protein
MKNQFMKGLALLVCVGMFAACGDDDENNVTVNNNTSANNTTANNTTANNTTANNTTANVDPGYDFRTDAPGTYTRVDAMGQPAVSTALVPAASKNGYNDDTPDIASYAGDMIATLTALHTALDDEIEAFSLVPCSMMDSDADGAGPLSPAGLVLPDTLKILDSSGAAGYPNGRKLADPVVDVILSVILLDQSEADPDSIVGVLNPAMNDANGGEFQATFPYVNAPFEAQ